MRFPAISTGFLALTALLLAGCASDSNSGGTSTGERSEPREEMKSEDMPRPAPTSVSDLMLAKTAWAAALLEAIAARDYGRVETNADALRRLSEDTSFIVQDTVTYRAYSHAFRDAVAQLAADARAKDQSAIESDYHRVTDSCFHCHAYVHEERQRNAMPGRVTLR